MSEWIRCPMCGALMTVLTIGHMCPVCGYRFPAQTVTQSCGTSAEYVEIVRCKDCEHWNGDDNETFCSELGIFGTDPNSFCSYARKKEEHSLEEMKAQGTE